MDWIMWLLRLMTQIILFSGCCFKQENGVCATNTTESVGVVHYEGVTVWDRNIHSSNVKEHGARNITSSGNKQNRVGVRRYRLRYPISLPLTDVPIKSPFAKQIASSSLISQSRNSQFNYINIRSRNIRSSDDNALSRNARTADVISRSTNARFADFMNCGNDEFQCHYTGACISKLSVCDRNIDCFLYEDDESDCSKTECSAGAFQCKSDECLSYTNRCDGIDKCWDSSDEVGCQVSTCPSHYYRCHSGQCIELTKRCDGNNFMITRQQILRNMFSPPIDEINLREEYWSRDSDGNYVYSDCLDGSDEWNCVNYTCPADHFKCKNGQCVSLSARCDNNTRERSVYIQDCNDGSDEEDCEVSECGDYFRCSDGRCVHPSGRCDNVAQCHDASDEKDCRPDNITCPLHSFSCGPGHCVPYTYRCSGRLIPSHNNVGNHCPSFMGELENYCPLSKCPNGYFRCRTGQCMRYDICNKQDNVNFCDQITDPIDHCGVTDCPRDYFRCENGHCLHHVSVCDNVTDCPEGEDETYCGRSECRKDQVDCGDGNCIPTALKCDQYNHCGNGQDETNCGSFTQTLTHVLCNISSQFVSFLDMMSCSFVCQKGCVCVNGLIDCSSPTFVFTEFENQYIWPFGDLLWVYTFPFTDIVPLSRIYSIVLPNSLLTKVPVGALRFTPYVQILDLSHNLLTDLRIGDFNGLYRLSLIDVSHNQIHTIDDFTFKGLRVLHLNIENNSIQHFGSDLFGGLAVDGTIRTDAFIFGRHKPYYPPAQNCYPDLDLMRHLHFLILLWIIGWIYICR